MKKNVFFFSKKTKKIVDGEGKLIEKFPFLKKAKVPLISEFNTFVNSFKSMLQNQFDMNLIFLEQQKDINENRIKFEVTKNEIKVSINFKDFISFIRQRHSFDNTFLIGFNKDVLLRPNDIKHALPSCITYWFSFFYQSDPLLLNYIRQ